jgi:hypothetical protein
LFAIACDFLSEFSRSPPGVRHTLAHLAQPSNCFRQKRLGHTLSALLLVDQANRMPGEVAYIRDIRR